MADTLTEKSVRVARGYTYGYYAAAPSRDSGKPTVLLLHGWPDDARMWFDLAKKHLLPAGYGVVIPDELGYGLTDKPRDPKEYNFAKLTQDMSQILDAEHVDKVVVIGHDWGSTMAQRLYLYAPERVLALGMANVAYIPPSATGTDMKALNDQLEAGYGMRCYEYMHFFASDESDAVAEAHLEAMFHLCYNDDFAKAAREIFSQTGKPKQALESDLLLPLHPTVTAEEKQRWLARLRRDGFNGPFNWYRSTVHHSREPEKTKAGPKVDVPTLYVGYTDDLVCRKENILLTQQAGLLPNLTNVTLQGGHFGLVQDPAPFASAVVNWLDSIAGALG